jgi:hypothetical protein
MGHRPNKGKTFSKEWCKHLSESKTGKPKPAGFGEKIRARLKNRPKSAEHRLNMSLAKKGKPMPKRGPMPEVQKEILRKIRIGTIWLLCPTNSETRFVDQENAAILMANGWVRCTRKMFRALQLPNRKKKLAVLGLVPQKQDHLSRTPPISSGGTA